MSIKKGSSIEKIRKKEGMRNDFVDFVFIQKV